MILALLNVVLVQARAVFVKTPGCSLSFPLSNGLAGTHLKDLASRQQLDTCVVVHRHAKDVHNLQTCHLACSTRHPCTARFTAAEEVAYGSSIGDR